MSLVSCCLVEAVACVPLLLSRAVFCAAYFSDCGAEYGENDAQVRASFASALLLHITHYASTPPVSFFLNSFAFHREFRRVQATVGTDYHVTLSNRKPPQSFGRQCRRVTRQLAGLGPWWG